MLRETFFRDPKTAVAVVVVVVMVVVVVVVPAALFNRLPGPPRAPGELEQRPREGGAAGLRAPAPPLAGSAARGGRGGCGGERCALLETRC
jgi:hypothetical protein